MASKQGGQDSGDIEDSEGIASLGSQALVALKEIKGPEVDELIALQEDLAESSNSKPNS